MSSTYDAAIIGAGAMGSAAAYYLAKSGQRVLLLEQFEIDHQRGSSWGYSRIIRYSYGHETYIKLARGTYPLWFDLERESGERLYVRTGGLDFGRPGDETLRDTIQAVRSADLAHEILSPREAEKRFPQFRFDDDMVVLYQPESGLLAPSKCVRAHIHLAQKHGADVHDHTVVTSIDIHSDSVTVNTTQGDYSAGKLIITAGAWAGGLLASIGLTLPLQPLRCQEAHFYPTENPALHEAGQMPVFIYHGRAYGDFALYGLPSHEGSGVKTAFHGGIPFNHPSEIDYTPDPAHLEHIRMFTRRHIPAIGDGKAGLTRICLYTMTPDEHFIIDTHPEHSHVAIGSPCSGHGFKFSTGIGKILADLVTHGSTDQDISLFSVRRFGK
jgi:monomeric sarcosine oxidase